MASLVRRYLLRAADRSDTPQNQSLLASSLQTAYNLNVLPELVQRSVTHSLTLRGKVISDAIQSHFRSVARCRGENTNDLRHDENIQGCARERCVFAYTLAILFSTRSNHCLDAGPDSHRYLHLHSSPNVLRAWAMAPCHPFISIFASSRVALPSLLRNTLRTSPACSTRGRGAKYAVAGKHYACVEPVSPAAWRSRKLCAQTMHVLYAARLAARRATRTCHAFQSPSTSLDCAPFHVLRTSSLHVRRRLGHPVQHAIPLPHTHRADEPYRAPVDGCALDAAGEHD